MNEGDIHLARALVFHGYAEGDGCLAAVEEAVETETGLHDCMRAFTFFALVDVAEAIDDIFKRWIDALNTDEDSEVDKVEEAAAQKYFELDVESRLTEAFERALERNPEAFAAIRRRR